MTIDINDLTIGQLKEISRMVGCHSSSSCHENHPVSVGDKLFIRTVTYHYTGQVEKIEWPFVYLKDAAWVAESGRWNEALTSGKLEEVEPYPNGVWVNLGSSVDFSIWGHQLITDVK